MADPRGFLTTVRQTPARRPVDIRIRDWREVYTDFGHADLERQAGRCMDCGIPFCHQGCPLGNLIPEWNDLVYSGDWRGAAERLHATNNFPEFTGRLCPAPCESACVLGINADPVTIKQVEVEIIDRAWAEGWVPPRRRLGGRRRGRPQGRGHRVRAGRAGRGAAAHQGRARRHRLRAGRRARRPAAVRDPRVQDGEAAPGPAARADARRGHRVPLRGRRRAPISAPPSCGRATTRSCWPAARQCRAACRCRAPALDGVHQAMEFLPLANRAVGRAEPADPRPRQERRHHRRRRHRRGLPRHRAPAGRRVGDPAGDPAATARPAAGRLSHGRPTRWSSGSPARTRRAASASTPSAPRSSWPTPAAAARAAAGRGGVRRRRLPGHSRARERELPCELRAARDGLHRRGARRR